MSSDSEGRSSSRRRSHDRSRSRSRDRKNNEGEKYIDIGRDKKVKIKIPDLSSTLYSLKQFTNLQVTPLSLRLRR